VTGERADPNPAVLGVVAAGEYDSKVQELGHLTPNRPRPAGGEVVVPVGPAEVSALTAVASINTGST
jgi:hypothetical protein